MEENKKYCQVNLNDDDDGVIWHTLLEHVIERTKFFEYLADTNHTNQTVNEMIWEQHHLSTIEFIDNLVHFYGSKRNFMREYDFVWIMARLKINDNLKRFLSEFPNFLSYAITLEFEFQDPAFYDDNVALLYTVHSEMIAFILLTDDEKKMFELKGILFQDELEVDTITSPIFIVQSKK